MWENKRRDLGLEPILPVRGENPPSKGASASLRRSAFGAPCKALSTGAAHTVNQGGTRSLDEAFASQGFVFVTPGFPGKVVLLACEQQGCQ